MEDPVYLEGHAQYFLRSIKEKTSILCVSCLRYTPPRYLKKSTRARVGRTLKFLNESDSYERLASRSGLDAGDVVRRLAGSPYPLPMGDSGNCFFELFRRG